MDALRIVRHFNGGVSLHDVLSSSRLMQRAKREMRREIEARSAQIETDAADWAFESHAARFFGGV